MGDIFMRKYLKLIFILCIMPIVMVCAGCDEPPPGDEPPVDTGKDYTINFVEEYQYEGPNGTEYAQYTMHSVQIDVGDTVTFPTTEWLFQNNKVQHHEDTHIILRWYYWGQDGMTIEVTEDYFTTQYTGGHMTLISEWGDAPKSITYDLDGGVNHPDNPSEASWVELQPPTKEGYKFVGWTASGVDIDQSIPNMYGGYMVTDNFVVKAHWERNEVVFIGNGEHGGSTAFLKTFSCY
jgi:uncharacterized repeat protein (TIGR02543 family)